MTVMIVRGHSSPPPPIPRLDTNSRETRETSLLPPAPRIPCLSWEAEGEECWIEVTLKKFDLRIMKTEVDFALGAYSLFLKTEGIGSALDGGVQGVRLPTISSIWGPRRN